MRSHKINLFYENDDGYRNVKCEVTVSDFKQEICISCADQVGDKEDFHRWAESFGHNCAERNGYGLFNIVLVPIIVNKASYTFCDNSQFSLYLCEI